jgi:hypothetical protein
MSKSSAECKERYAVAVLMKFLKTPKVWRFSSDRPQYRWHAPFISTDGWQKIQNSPQTLEFWIHRHNIAGVAMLVRSIVSRLVCRYRGRAVVELENLALRHQLHVLRRQRPGRLRLSIFYLGEQLRPACLGDANA